MVQSSMHIPLIKEIGSLPRGLLEPRREFAANEFFRSL
jgi:hypothetical protein